MDARVKYFLRVIPGHLAFYLETGEDFHDSEKEKNDFVCEFLSCKAAATVKRVVRRETPVEKRSFSCREGIFLPRFQKGRNTKGVS